MQNGKYFYKYIVKLDYCMIIVPPLWAEGGGKKVGGKKSKIIFFFNF